MKERRTTVEQKVNGEEVPVPHAAHLKCPKCGEVMFRYRDLKRLEQDASDIYRRKHHLLSADEIRALRQRLGLTQARLAKLLKLGAMTVSRWESGRNVQTAAMDILLRLMRDVPGNVRWLKKHAA